MPQGTGRYETYLAWLKASRIQAAKTRKERRCAIKGESSQMTKRKRKAGPEEGEEGKIDFGVGKISIGGLGGIFGGIGKLIDSVARMSEEGPSVISEKGEIRGLGEKAKGVYGFTIRTLAGGETKVEPFGNIKRTPKGPVVEELREPIVDVFDEKDHILVVAELAGVQESDIKVEVKGDVLNLSAERGNRKYSKEVLLPSKVDGKSFSSSYKNGILEIKLERAEEGK